jgi:hypothetical protein
MGVIKKASTIFQQGTYREEVTRGDVAEEWKTIITSIFT